MLSGRPARDHVIESVHDWSPAGQDIFTRPVTSMARTAFRLGGVFVVLPLLTWFFPLRSEDGALQRAHSLFANNLAMRREVCARYPFPEIEGSSRGACLVLTTQLASADVPVFHNPLARAAHPAPNGFVHVSKRALAQGRDCLLRERIHGSRLSASWLASGYRLLRHWAGAAWKIGTGIRRVGLNPLLMPAAVAVAGYYYLLYWPARRCCSCASRSFGEYEYRHVRTFNRTEPWPYGSYFLRN
jgi:hypothetical protein